MNASRAITLLKHFCNHCGNKVSWLSDGKFSVSLTIDLGFDVLHNLAEEEIFVIINDSSLQRLFIEHRSGVVPVGTSITIQIVNQVEKIVVIPALAELLKLNKAHQSTPRACMIWKDGHEPQFYESELSEVPKLAKSYHSAIHFWKFLKQYCDHQDSESDSLLFFGIRRVEILPGVLPEILEREIDISGVIAFMEDADRKEMRREILTSRLTEHLKHHEAKDCFSYLVSTVSVFARGLREAMAIYLADHSPEILAKEAEKAALDYADKLEKIVSGLETKSLTIPPALFVAYTQIKSGSMGNNIVVCITGLLYFVAMGWVWFTQSSLLDLLHKTIKAKRIELESKGLDQENPIINETLLKLQDRAYSSEKFSAVIMCCSACPLVFALARWLC